MSDYKHARVRESEPVADDTVKHTTSSYYDQLRQTKVEIEKHIRTTRTTLLKDIISCLDHIVREDSPELTIKIKTNNGEPALITKTYTESVTKHQG